MAAVLEEVRDVGSPLRPIDSDFLIAPTVEEALEIGGGDDADSDKVSFLEADEVEREREGFFTAASMDCS